MNSCTASPRLPERAERTAHPGKRPRDGTGSPHPVPGRRLAGPRKRRRAGERQKPAGSSSFCARLAISEHRRPGLCLSGEKEASGLEAEYGSQKTKLIFLSADSAVMHRVRTQIWTGRFHPQEEPACGLFRWLSECPGKQVPGYAVHGRRDPFPVPARAAQRSVLC